MSEIMMEDVHEDRSQYPFLYHAESPTLWQMASHRVCHTLWYTYISRRNKGLKKIVCDKDFKHQHNVEKSLEGMQLPRSIEEMLKKDILKIINRLTAWVLHLKTVVFHDDNFEIDINWCTWDLNGEIDYKRSAQKIVRDDRLTEVEKFVVMSMYCMRQLIENNFANLRNVIEDIDKISSDLEQHEDYAKYSRFRRHTLVCYWMRFLRRDKDKLSLRYDAYGDSDLEMARMCWQDLKNNAMGFEYFWNRLGNADRSTLASTCCHFQVTEGIDPFMIWSLLERLLSLLQTASFDNPFSVSHIALDYLKCSLIYSNSTQHPLKIYHRFKNDDEFGKRLKFKFYEIFANVIDREDRMRVLINVWDMLNEPRRRRVVQWSSGIFESLAKCDDTNTPRAKKLSPCPSAFDFMYQIASMQSKDDRTQCFLKHGKRLAVLMHDAHLLKKMFDLFLPNINDQIDFKNQFICSERLHTTCTSLLKSEKYGDLNSKLQWVFSESGGENAIQAYKKQILTTMTWKYANDLKTFFVTVGKWTKLSEFIDQTYAQDTDSALEMKIRFITKANLTTRYNQEFRRNFDVIKQVVETVLPAEPLLLFKHTHLHAIGERLEGNVYWLKGKKGDDKFLRNLVEWCCNYDQKLISKFKKSIPELIIFNSALDRLNRLFQSHYEVPANLKQWLCLLDEHLKWFLGSDEKVGECKSREIEHPSVNLEFICNPLKSYGSENAKEQCRMLILKWIFSGDEAAIQSFQVEKFARQGVYVFVNKW